MLEAIAPSLIFLFEVIAFWTVWKILDLTFNHKIEKLRQHLFEKEKEEKEVVLKIAEDTRLTLDEKESNLKFKQ